MQIPENIDFEVIENEVRVIQNGEVVFSVSGEDRWKVIENIYGEDILN